MQQAILEIQSRGWGLAFRSALVVLYKLYIVDSLVRLHTIYSMEVLLLVVVVVVILPVLSPKP